MTITLNTHQEQAIQEALRAGRIGSVEEFIDHALAELSPHGPGDATLVERGLGLFGSAEDAALLDEVVALAYEERHRPSREPARRHTSLRTGRLHGQYSVQR